VTIRHIIFDLKITALLAFIFIFLGFTQPEPVSSFAFGGAFTVTLSTCYFALKKGIFKINRRITKNGLNYELREYISFTDPQKNHIALTTPNGGLDSVIYPNSGFKKWGYFDEIRMILKRYVSYGNYTNLKVLVLGGGLGTIPGSMSLNPRIKTITVVEAFGEVVNLCEQYSLSLLSNKCRRKIRIITGDGIKYIQKATAKFDIIFVDMFNEAKIVDAVYSKEFVEKTVGLLSKRGILLTNHGIRPGGKYAIGIDLIKRSLANYRVYYTGKKSFIGVGSKVPINYIPGLVGDQVC